MSHVALVEHSGVGSSINYFPTLSLMKLATLHKEKGDTVERLFSGDYPSKNPDIFYFSPLFSFRIKKDLSYIFSYKKKYPNSKVIAGGNVVAMNQEIFKKYCDEIKPDHYEEIEKQPPDYDLFKSENLYGFTTRGCVRSCPWCIVPKSEGKIVENIYWKNSIDDKRKKFIGMDNNFTASKMDHVKDVIETLNEKKINYEFNQGLDLELFVKRNEFHEYVLKNGNFSRLLFSWDSERVSRYIEEFILIIDKYNFNHNKILFYVLYDFEDSLDVILNRIKKLYFLEFQIKPMQFRDLKSGQTGYGLWRKEEKNVINDLISSIFLNGVINDKSFKKIFESSNEEIKKFSRQMKASRKFTPNLKHTKDRINLFLGESNG